MRAGVERLAQVLRVVDDGNDEQPLVAVWMWRQTVEVLGHRSVLAVRHAVLTQIPLAKLRRLHFQRSAAIDLRDPAWRRTAPQPLSPAARDAPVQQAAARHARIVARPAADAWALP